MQSAAALESPITWNSHWLVWEKAEEPLGPGSVAAAVGLRFLHALASQRFSLWTVPCLSFRRDPAWIQNLHPGGGVGQAKRCHGQPKQGEHLGWSNAAWQVLRVASLGELASWAESLWENCEADTGAATRCLVSPWPVAKADRGLLFLAERFSPPSSPLGTRSVSRRSRVQAGLQCATVWHVQGSPGYRIGPPPDVVSRLN